MSKNKATTAADLTEIFENFYDNEVDRWELLNKNLDILSTAIDNEKSIQTLDTSNWEVYARRVNYRKASLSAKVDNESLAKRACFLCSDNRPEEQGVIHWENYDFLANPYPLADMHFTIASTEHTPQRIAGKIKDMARITRMLPGNCTFYNGPLCGASAPDHFHFQSFHESMSMNMWRPVEELCEVFRFGKSRVYRPQKGDTPFPYFLISSASDKELADIFDRIYKALPPAEPEPMMNIIMIKDGGRMRTLIVPRSKHRPSFYGTGEGEMLVSPASVEMLGTFITSREEDFDRLDAETVRRIYNEVCLSDDEFDSVVAGLTAAQQ